MKGIFRKLLPGFVYFCIVPISFAAAPVHASDVIPGPTAPVQSAQTSDGSNEPLLTQGSLTALSLPGVTIYGVADQPTTVPVSTRFGTQYNVVTEERISRLGALDFYDALRTVPGVMFQKKNIIGGQTSHSLYIRGRGASHPSPDLTILFDDVPRSGVLYGQTLADGMPVYALGGMEIYKYPQPSRFGSGYGMINFIPKYMTDEGTELRMGFEGGSHGTYAEHLGAGIKQGSWDIYAAQSFISTDGHVGHSAAQQESYYLNLGYRLNENWSIRLLGNYVDAKTEAPDNPLTGARASTRRYDTETSLITLSLTHQYDQANGYLKLYQNKTNFYLIGESNGTARSKQSNELMGLRVRETFSLWEGNEFVAGFDLDQSDLANEQSAGKNEYRWDFPDQTVFSPYIAISQLFGNEGGWHAIPSAGIRYYSHDTFKDATSPQAGLVLGYDRTALSFNYARGVNYPSPVVLQNFLRDKSLPSGFDTERIKPEVVDHYEVSLNHSWEGLGALGATYFYDRGKNRTRAYMFGAAPDESFFNSSTARYKIRGVEVTGSVTPLEGVELFAGATWLNAKATGDDGKEQDKMPYTPSFTLQAGFAWNFYDNFTLSGDYQHLRDVYAATSARTANPANPSSAFGELSGIDKLHDINVFNLRLDYAFTYEPLNLKDSKVYVRVDNVFDADYAYALEKNASNTERGMYWMPGTTYMVGMELKF